MMLNCPRTISTLMLLLTTSLCHSEEWRRITPDIQFVWPRDLGSHPDTRTEWWYATGEFTTESGASYGYQVTFFRQGIDPAPLQAGQSRLRAKHVIAGHFGLASIDSQQFKCSERIRRQDGLLAEARPDRLQVSVDDWSMKMDDSGDLLISVSDAENDTCLDLRLHPLKPLVLQGMNGYSQKGRETGNASAYISWTRLATTGTLTVKNQTHDIHGESWFDREWGTSQLDENVTGWDWFGLRLANGQELMVYGLRQQDGHSAPQSGGTLVTPDGQSVHLSREDFSIEVQASWTSPATGITYPSGWHIRIPSHGLDINVSPKIPNAELNAQRSTGTTYWEGPVTVSGSVNGQGYAELTGYGESMKARF